MTHHRHRTDPPSDPVSQPSDRTDAMVLPGAEPTDEDLRQDAELTREELARTVAALGQKADVKTRVRTEAHRRAETARTRGDHLIATLPPPLATTLAPAWHTLPHRPAIPAAALAALLLLAWRATRRRHHTPG